MKKKRITILTQYFYPEVGAPQTRLLETAIGLKEMGWEVNVITAFPNYPTGKIDNKYRFKLNVTEDILGIKVHRYWMLPSNNKSTVPRIISMLSFTTIALISIIKLWKFKPDFILTESPPLTLGFTGLLLAKLTSAKHIFNVSDIWPLSAFELGVVKQNSILYRYSEKIEKKIYKNSAATIGQSEEIVAYLEGCKINKVSLYRNGVNFNKFKDSYPKELSNRKKIVYTGLLGVAQGITEICKNVNFAQLNVEFHIYGDGPEKNELLKFISTNNNSHIFYKGTISNSDIPLILKNYDYTLIPLVKSIYGAVPSKIYEAMASGTPILFAGSGEGAKLVSKYQIGHVCEPNDYRGIEKEINVLTNLDDEAMLKLQTNGRAAARNIFDRKIQIKNLDTFLQSI